MSDVESCLNSEAVKTNEDQGKNKRQELEKNGVDFKHPPHTSFSRVSTSTQTSKHSRCLLL